MRAIPSVNSVLQKPNRSKPFVVHVDKIKRCFGETPKSWLPTTGDDVATQPHERIVTQPSPVKQVACQDPSPKCSRQRRGSEEQTEVSDSEVEMSRPQRENRRPPSHLDDYRW